MRTLADAERIDHVPLPLGIAAVRSLQQLANASNRQAEERFAGRAATEDQSVDVARWRAALTWRLPRRSACRLRGVDTELIEHRGTGDRGQPQREGLPAEIETIDRKIIEFRSGRRLIIAGKQSNS